MNSNSRGLSFGKPLAPQSTYSLPACSMGGMIVDDDLQIPLPKPEKCISLRRRSPAQKQKSRGSQRHSQLDVIRYVRKNEQMEKKQRYRLHVYPSMQATEQSPRGGMTEEPSVKEDKQQLIRIAPTIPQRPQTTPSLPESESVMFAAHELQCLLKGCGVKISSASNPEPADYFLLFSEKAVAEKHIRGVVSDLISFPSNGGVKFFTVSVLQLRGNLSLRISLRSENATLFYDTMSRKANTAAIGSTDMPFPENVSHCTEAQKKRLLYAALVGVLEKRDLQLQEMLFPTHIFSARDYIWKPHASGLRGFLFESVDEKMVADYFGEETAFYFAWMNHYQKWLLGASILWLISYFIGALLCFPPDRNPLPPLNTFALIIGSVLCVKLWERKCHILFLKFNMLHNQVKDEKNWQFKGKLVFDAVHGGHKLYYPSWKRGCILQPVAWAIVFMYMVLAAGVNICSANLDGIIPEDSRFSIQRIRYYSLEGSPFAADSFFWWFPPLAYSVCTMGLGLGFNFVGRKLTEFENYSHRGDYICAFTQKRVALEVVNRYFKLLLVVFVCQDFNQISAHVRSVFVFAEFIRVLTEMIIPFLITHRTHLLSMIRGKVCVGQEVDENLQEYEVYSDFVEMAMQLGFISLFATAYPVAPLVAYISNIVEVKSDLFKLCFVVRRPVPRYGSSQLATWCDVFRCIAGSSVITNTFLLVFTGIQIQYLFPFMASVESNNAYMILFVIIEHVVMSLCGFLFWRIPTQPKIVKDHIKRQKVISAGLCVWVLNSHHSLDIYYGSFLQLLFYFVVNKRKKKLLSVLFLLLLLWLLRDIIIRICTSGNYYQAYIIRESNVQLDVNSVDELFREVARRHNIEDENTLRLVFRGRLIQRSDSLESLQLSNGAVVAMTVGNGPHVPQDAHNAPSNSGSSMDMDGEQLGNMIADLFRGMGATVVSVASSGGSTQVRHVPTSAVPVAGAAPNVSAQETEPVQGVPLASSEPRSQAPMPDLIGNLLRSAMGQTQHSRAPVAPSGLPIAGVYLHLHCNLDELDSVPQRLSAFQSQNPNVRVRVSTAPPPPASRPTPSARTDTTTTRTGNTAAAQPAVSGGMPNVSSQATTNSQPPQENDTNVMGNPLAIALQLLPSIRENGNWGGLLMFRDTVLTLIPSERSDVQELARILYENWFGVPSVATLIEEHGASSFSSETVIVWIAQFLERLRAVMESSADRQTTGNELRRVTVRYVGGLIHYLQTTLGESSLRPILGAVSTGLSALAGRSGMEPVMNLMMTMVNVIFSFPIVHDTIARWTTEYLNELMESGDPVHVGTSPSVHSHAAEEETMDDLDDLVNSLLDENEENDDDGAVYYSSDLPAETAVVQEWEESSGVNQNTARILRGILERETHHASGPQANSATTVTDDNLD
eukprot:gene4292-3108_t